MRQSCAQAANLSCLKNAFVLEIFIYNTGGSGAAERKEVGVRIKVRRERRRDRDLPVPAMPPR